MKRILLFMLFFVGLWVIPGLSHAADGQAQIYLNDKRIGAEESSKIEIINGSVMIPIRMVAEELGYNVKWEQNTGTVTIQQGIVMKMVVNDKNALVDNQSVVLDSAPVVRSGTTLVPLRFVGEQFGLKVSWDNSTKTAKLAQVSGSGEGSSPPAGSGNTGGGTINDPQALVQVSGIGFSANQLQIATSSSVTPKVFTMTGPDRIVVDLPNTQFSTDFAGELNVQGSGSMQVTEYPMVSQIRYSLFSTDPSTVRIVIDLKEAAGYSVSQAGTSLLIVDLNQDTVPPPSTTEPDTTLPETPPVTNPSQGNGKKIVVLDAGHGAQDGGTVGATGKLEKDFNLSLTLKVEALLKKESNIEVILTRSGDTYPELLERAKIANNADADIFLSIHANSATPSANGTETFYKKSQDKALADIIHKHLIKATGLKDRKVKSANYSVLRNTDMPAALLEIGFLSNKAEEATLFDKDFQNKVAQSIVDGIKEYLKL